MTPQKEFIGLEDVGEGKKYTAVEVSRGALCEIRQDDGPRRLMFCGSVWGGGARLGSYDEDGGGSSVEGYSDLYIKIEGGAWFFGLESDDGGCLRVPRAGLNLEKGLGKLSMVKGEASAREEGYYRVACLGVENIDWNPGSNNAIALNVVQGTSEVEEGDYSGGNTFSRHFSEGEAMKLYVLLGGDEPEGEKGARCDCGCSQEGVGSGRLGSIEWEMPFGSYGEIEGIAGARIGLRKQEIGGGVRVGDFEIQGAGERRLIDGGERWRVVSGLEEEREYRKSDGMGVRRSQRGWMGERGG